MPNNPISLPGGYAPAFAIGYADSTTGDLAVVESGKPLPVMAISPTAPTPLAGSATAPMLTGPFSPVLGRPVHLTLSGVWQGTVVLQRSADGGLSKHPLTIGGQSWGRFTGNVCEPVWEEQVDGIRLFLAIDLVSGQIEYEMAQ